jgi:uncharacterized protein YigA (DUF484 family)
MNINEHLAEEAVKLYLLKHPSFFMHQSDLLNQINLQQQKALLPSLIERQVNELRKKNEALQKQLKNMMHSAYQNEALLSQYNQFMLALAQVKNLKMFSECIVEELKILFNLDACALFLVGEYPECPPAQIKQHVPAIKKTLKSQFPLSNTPLCGRIEKSVKWNIFGEKKKELQSSAFIPLGENCQYGLLVLASNDETRFSPDMGTLFIDLIAKTLLEWIKKHYHLYYHK